MTYHPWRELRRRADIDLVFAPLPPPLHAATDGRVIWMHDKLLQVERRCALVHELVHIERGDTCTQSEAVERAVRGEAARRLIPFEDLVDAARWSRDHFEVADDLWVTPTVLADRIGTLTPDELATLRA